MRYEPSKNFFWLLCEIFNMVLRRERPMTSLGYIYRVVKEKSDFGKIVKRFRNSQEK